jgi:hypothetical protein
MKWTDDLSQYGRRREPEYLRHRLNIAWLVLILLALLIIASIAAPTDVWTLLDGAA